ncbi:MAG: hypothetical protein ACI9C4_003312, partial [Paraglaciecola sp.]
VSKIKKTFYFADTFLYLCPQVYYPGSDHGYRD